MGRKVPFAPRPNRVKHQDSWLAIRISSRHIDRLQTYAEQQGTNRSRLLRDWIDSLPIQKSDASA